MSVQFGRWNFEGQPPAQDFIEKVSAILAPYGPDHNEAYSKAGVTILYFAFHTTKESRRETQPHISPSGAVITWDGRLDNRADLISELRDSLTIAATDVAIVAAAYEKWGASCLGKLIGDWALSLWNPREHSVLLAKDPIGTRHLYYSFNNNQVTWSTILDPLVLSAGRTFEICEEYIAGWFSYFPAAHLTPYIGIHAVPPSSSVFFRPGKHTISKYWDFDPNKKIRYRTDAEYEEHFRTVFAKSVQHKLRSDRPILAELSGGMDSSSIVSMADTVIARGAAETPRLDTVSWDVHSDPSILNEHAYFSKVEEKRGRTGYHIDVDRREHVGSHISLAAEFECDHFSVTPVPSFRHSKLFKRTAEHMRSQGYRITLSGIGGESATGGGVPTPGPELQNLMARAHLFTLSHQLKAWAVKMRKARSALLLEAAGGFWLSLPALGVSKDILATPWFNSGFVRRNRTALLGYPSRVNLFGPLPSFQDHMRELDAERRLLAFYTLCPELLHEVRYPYLDRGLLEFMYSIPQEQIVRVGQRRSLMKRALAGIVPDEVLKRRRTAPVQQELPKDNPAKSPNFLSTEHLICGAIGIVDSNQFLEAFQETRYSERVLLESLKRTALLESWLRHLTIHGVLMNSRVTMRQDCPPSLLTRESQVATLPKSSAS
ncbi:MAG: asparagine synthase-related protein [Terriglobales bacterium]|jgi:asparagine synthase (glutamine-hydrolysing)